jgi:hypothetical protein
MITATFGRGVLGIGLATVLLAGCNGSQAGVPGTIPQGAMTTTQGRAHQATTYNTILYVSRYSNYVDMLTYPGLKAIGSFTYPNNTPFGQACPDDLTGNIYFPNYSGQPNAGLLEYADGGTAPIGSLKPTPGHFAVNCAVDSMTGNIAVVLATTAQTSSYIGVYAPGSSRPTKYGYPNLRWYASCRYDSSGNLFILGETNTYQSSLLELPKGGSKLMKLSLRLKAYITLEFPIRWDGSYITIQSLDVGNGVLTIYRISVSGSAAKIVGKTELHGAAMSLWIQDGNTVITGRQAKSREGYRNVAFYDYPAGGRPRSVFRGLKDEGNQILGLAVATLPSGSHIRK